MIFSKKSKRTMNVTEQYTEVFDEALALRSVGGDREFLTEVVGLTQAAWPTLLADIRNGLVRGDFRAVETTARLAKAAARYVSARRAYDSALQLEAMARKEDLPAAQGARERLEIEVEILELALSTLGNSGVAP